MKNVLKGKHFADVEMAKQKRLKYQKASKLMSSETVLNSGKNVLIGALHQMKSILEVTAI